MFRPEFLRNSDNKSIFALSDGKSGGHIDESVASSLTGNLENFFARGMANTSHPVCVFRCVLHRHTYGCGVTAYSHKAFPEPPVR